MNEVYLAKLISLVSQGVIKEEQIKDLEYRNEVHKRLNPESVTTTQIKDIFPKRN